MNVLLRNRRKIYYCELYLEDGIEKFKEPQEVMINFEPTNSKSHIFAFGNYYPIYLSAIVLSNFKIKFKAGDRCYIYKKPPEEHDILWSGADYEVETDVMKTINFTEVKFKRLTSDIDYE